MNNAVNKFFGSRYRAGIFFAALSVFFLSLALGAPNWANGWILGFGVCWLLLVE